jgi:hypothetical protein
MMPQKRRRIETTRRCRPGNCRWSAATGGSVPRPGENAHTAVPTDGMALRDDD